MAKLYATLETSRGKTVSISDDSEIIATVYDGNMKACSVIIEWSNIGDPEHIKCNHCDWQGNEQDLEIRNDKEQCPECKKGDALMDMPATMGAIVTTREWRNRPQTNDRQKAQGKA